MKRLILSTASTMVFAFASMSSLLPVKGVMAQENCDYVFRDCNHNGVANELDDVVTMIAYYRGTAIPAYTCNCPPHDSLFVPDADPDGNCVPFEMSDVVAILSTPPDWPWYGCPDCPGDYTRRTHGADVDTISRPQDSEVR